MTAGNLPLRPPRWRHAVARAVARGLARAGERHVEIAQMLEDPRREVGSAIMSARHQVAGLLRQAAELRQQIRDLDRSPHSPALAASVEQQEARIREFDGWLQRVALELEEIDD